MTPGKIRKNDLDRALMALVGSKSALPRSLRELGTGEKWFLMPFKEETNKKPCFMTRIILQPLFLLLAYPS
jgi:hypothetical protein